MVDARAVVTLDDVRGDLLLLTVPDDAIGATAAELAGFNGRAVVHTSGARDAGDLAALAARGLAVGSLHPAYPFADVERAMAGLAGATFAVEAEDAMLLGWLRELVQALDGRVIAIPAGGKVLYHVALALLSNYTVTLYALAERLLLGLGAEPTAADAALNRLLAGTVENLREQGIPDALTGALARGDTGTVVAHLKALDTVALEIAVLYRQLGVLSLPLLASRGMEADKIAQIEQLLKRDTPES